MLKNSSPHSHPISQPKKIPPPSRSNLSICRHECIRRRKGAATHINQRTVQHCAGLNVDSMTAGRDLDVGSFSVKVSCGRRITSRAITPHKHSLPSPFPSPQPPPIPTLHKPVPLPHDNLYSNPSNYSMRAVIVIDLFHNQPTPSPPPHTNINTCITYLITIDVRSCMHAHLTLAVASFPCLALPWHLPNLILIHPI